jgi:hypothetical protein
MVAGTVYHSQAPEFAADFSGVRVAYDFSVVEQYFFYRVFSILFW